MVRYQSGVFLFLVNNIVRKSKNALIYNIATGS